MNVFFFFIQKSFLLIYLKNYNCFFSFQEVVLAVWHKTASDQVASACIQDTIRQVLHLPSWTILEYKIHCKSLRYHFDISNIVRFLKYFINT